MLLPCRLKKQIEHFMLQHTNAHREHRVCLEGLQQWFAEVLASTSEYSPPLPLAPLPLPLRGLLHAVWCPTVIRHRRGLTDHTLYAVRCMPRAIRCKPRADHRTLPTDRHCNAVATSHEDCCNSVQPSQVDHTTLPKTHATDADERLDSVLKALPDAVQELDGPKVP